MSHWRPIATAPKDGTPVLLFARAKTATASAPVIGWCINGDWIECCFSPNRPVGLVPTHWMPRPAFPGEHWPEPDWRNWWQKLIYARNPPSLADYHAGAA